jgi:catechol 2,3-dioxygenase-like lactoylglutathione lyase family enzyme
MNLGNFSISLAVKDLAVSRSFYEKLGFRVFGGDENQGWLIMQSPSCVIGLFQGMIEKNTLTFNPGWDSAGRKLEEFSDVREIQKRLKAEGMEIVSEADETTSGPASCMVIDPDGNPILLDQHV